MEAGVSNSWHSLSAREQQYLFPYYFPDLSVGIIETF